MNSRITLALCLGLSLLAQEPDEKARDQFKQSAYQSLVSEFGVGKAFWNPDHVARAPITLRRELRDAISSGSEGRVLGILDAIDDLDHLDASEKALKAQVAYVARFWKEGEKASRDTELNGLFKALERERRGKTEKGAPSSQEIVRADRYALLRGSAIVWPGFRTLLLKPEIDSLLASEAFIARGEMPPGFDEEWLKGCTGKPEHWDQHWAQAWASGSPVRISGLLNRIQFYRPGGLSDAQAAEILARISNDQAFPYIWADSPAMVPEAHFPVQFREKVAAAKKRGSGRREDAVAFAKYASTPRDYYEVSMLLEAQGDEGALKVILDSGKFLLADPGVPGWTAAAAQNRLDGLKARYEQLVTARVEAERQAELARKKAEEEARRAERLRQEQEARERMEALMNRRVGSAVSAMEIIARGHFRGDRSQIDSGIEQLSRIMGEFRESEAALSVFKRRVMDAWSSGPGASIASDSTLSPAERSGLSALLKQVIAGVKPAGGGGASEE